MNGQPGPADEYRGGPLRRWKLVALIVALLVVLLGSLLIGPLSRMLAAL